MRLTNITLVLPTRNEAENIARVIAALPNELQLIVVDSSDDGTPEMIEHMRTENTIVLRESGTLGRARQVGADLARTDWLLFSTADVLFAPDYFDRLQRLEGHIVYYGPTLSRDRFRRYYRWLTSGQLLSHQCGIPAATGANLLVPRSALHEVGGFDCALESNAVSELVWRVKRAGFRVRFSPDLAVEAIAHRHLERGCTSTALRSLAHCMFLYANILPSRRGD